MYKLIPLALVSLATAYPGHELRYRQAPSNANGVSRSPCPALNVLANIGKLPKDGRNITAPMFESALKEVYNVDAAFATQLAQQGLTSVPHASSNALDLSDLNKHDAIEHDASLVHADSSTGDNHTPQAALLEALLADADGEYLTITSMAKTRSRRDAESQKAGNPALSTFLSTLAYGEAALVLQVLGQYGPKEAGEYAVPKQAARQWLLEERLPDGFQRPKTPISFASTTALSAKILGKKTLDSAVGGAAGLLSAAASGVASGAAAGGAPGGIASALTSAVAGIATGAGTAGKSGEALSVATGTTGKTSGSGSMSMDMGMMHDGKGMRKVCRKS